MHVAAAKAEEDDDEPADRDAYDGGDGQNEAVVVLGVELIWVDSLDGVLGEDGLVQAEETAGSRTLITPDGEGDEDLCMLVQVVHHVHECRACAYSLRDRSESTLPKHTRDTGQSHRL